MKSTMRVTWALVSVGFLFHFSCSTVTTTSNPVPSPANTPTTTKPTVAVPVKPVTTKPVTVKPTTAQVTTTPVKPTDAQKTTLPPAVPTPSKAPTTTVPTMPTTQPRSTAPTTQPPASPAKTSANPQLLPAVAVTTAATTKASATSQSAVAPGSQDTTVKLLTTQPATSSQGHPGPALTTYPYSQSGSGPQPSVPTSTQVMNTTQNQNYAGNTTSPAVSTPISNPTTEGNVTTPSQTPSTDTSNNATDVVAATTITVATTTIATIRTSETTTTVAVTTEGLPRIFSILMSSIKGDDTNIDEDLAEVCRKLTNNMEDANCTLEWQPKNGKKDIKSGLISGRVNPKLARQFYEETTKKSGDNTTLIAILASCGALLAMIIGLAIYASHHRKPYNENQQHLTEELHTVENGYHDNPTLEVMEVQPEMQEKKVALNGEFNDSWIVPIDNLLKDETPDEEDTHL